MSTTTAETSTVSKHSQPASPEKKHNFLKGIGEDIILSCMAINGDPLAYEDYARVKRHEVQPA